MRDKILSRWSWAVPAIVLGLGFLDLIRGGITISAILLAIGFLVAIPWALITGSRAAGDLPPYREAIVAGIAVLALYLLTLSPSTAMWDASEYIAAAYTFGLPHPPGNPLFVIVGRVFSILPIAPNVAMRINVLAAVSSAVAAAIWYLVARRVAVRAGLDPLTSRIAAALATLIGATAFTVWNQSVVNEKVYTVSLAGIAIISWLMLRWSDQPDSPRADRLLLLVAYLLGLGYANHMAGMLPLPAVALMVLFIRPRTVLRWRLLAASAAMMLVGLLPFATQPIRSAFNPPINEGEPTACRQGIAFSCTFSKQTWEAFRYNFNREQFGKPKLSERQAPFAAQIGMWWLYFKWQWWRDAHEETAPMPAQDHERRHDVQTFLAALFFLLALTGGILHHRHDRRGFWYFGPLMLLMSIVLIYYLNFRYGASQATDLTNVEREVRDRDYFFLWSFSAWGVWAGLGLVWVWRSLASLGDRGLTDPSSRRLALAAPVLLLAIVPLAGNWSAASRRNDRIATSFARDLLNSVEPYGVLVTGGDNDTFPLWYAQEVEGVRRDVTVAVTSLMNTDWFARGMIRRPIHAYDAKRGPAVYRDRDWPRPDSAPLHLTLEEADSIPQYMLVTQPLRFQAGGLDIRIDPRFLPQAREGGGGILERSDLLVLRMVADTWPHRPVYISRTAGAYGETLGLGNNLLSQGLARKLVTTPTASRDTVYVPGSGWIDIRRTRALWDDFAGPSAIVKRNDWIDRPSVSIAFSYLVAGSELASLLSERKEVSAGDSVMATLRRVARTVRVDHLMTESNPPPVPRGDTSR